MTGNHRNNDDLYQEEDFELDDTIVLIDEDNIEHSLPFWNTWKSMNRCMPCCYRMKTRKMEHISSALKRMKTAKRSLWILKMMTNSNELSPFWNRRIWNKPIHFVFGGVVSIPADVQVASKRTWYDAVRFVLVAALIICIGLASVMMFGMRPASSEPGALKKSCPHSIRGKRQAHCRNFSERGITCQPFYVPPRGYTNGSGTKTASGLLSFRC